jgi:hypothetical protein
MEARLVVLLPATLDPVRRRGIRAQCRLEAMVAEHRDHRMEEAMVSLVMARAQDMERTPMATVLRRLRGVVVAMVV